MSAPPSPVHLAVSLDGSGWHPAAWRETTARPADLFDARYWAELVREAERGLLDFVTIEDSLALQAPRFTETDGRTDQVRGRLDAVLIAARVAPLTRHIGLLPTVVVTHTEPFHVSKAIATLDYVSNGRAGLQVKVSGRRDEAALFGRRVIPDVSPEAARGSAGPPFALELFDEARDYVEVLRRLWDSWEDDAEIRDIATGRFVDRDRLHYIDYVGDRFSVKGPSITPRPPQGQPIVAALAHRRRPFELVATSADIGFVTPSDSAGAAAIVAEVRSLQADAGRAEEQIRLFGDLVVFLDDGADEGAQRKQRLDDLAGEEYRSDAHIFTGSASELADLLLDWQKAGLAGFRLRPAVLPDDLRAITRSLAPELQRRGAFRSGYESTSLRGSLGLGRPANRHTAA